MRSGKASNTAKLVLARDKDNKATLRMRPYVDGIVLRVAFIDDVLQKAAPRQVVILGAGLDTRAWRLEALRGVRVFEVDHPATQTYKRQHATAVPLADLTYVTVDFTRDSLEERLLAAGFDQDVPTVWVWEGVIMYLPDDALRSSLGVIKRLSATGSTLLAHYHEPVASKRATFLRRLLFSWLGEAQVGLRTREVMRRELTGAGFHVVEDAGIPEQAARVGGNGSEKAQLRMSRIMVAE